MPGNRGNDSDDDFQSNSTNQPKNTNINIPVGHILCAPKWKSTPITAKLSETIKVLYSPGLGVVDFHPSSDCAIVFVSAAELVEGLQYKKRLATLRNLKIVRKIVVGERTPVSLQHYNTLQHFAVIELDINLIPVSDNCLPALLTQTVFAENRMNKNPFLSVSKKSRDEDGPKMLSALKNVPKLGDKKVQQLLEKFDSIHSIATAPVEQLISVLGAAVGQSVWEYFNK